MVQDGMEERVKVARERLRRKGSSPAVGADG